MWWIDSNWTHQQHVQLNMYKEGSINTYLCLCILFTQFSIHRPSLTARMLKNRSAIQETLVRILGWQDLLERDKLPAPVFLSFPGSSVSKEFTCNVENLCLIPGLGISPGEQNRYPLQYSGLENSMDCIAHGVAQSQTWLSNFHFHSTLICTHISKICHLRDLENKALQ